MFRLGSRTGSSFRRGTQIEEMSDSENNIDNSTQQLILNKKFITLLESNKDEEIISQFIETSEIDINYCNNEYNPLFYIFKKYRNNTGELIKNLKFLNNYGVNYNIIWDNNQIPLFEFLKMETNICLKLLTLAKESGANMYQLDTKKRNLLMYALELKLNFKVIRYLFSLNYNLSNQDIEGNTIYNYAIVYYNIYTYNRVLPFLLKNFVYSNDVIIKLILMGKYKQSASKQDIVSIIKSNNELINIKNNEGDNALFIAIKNFCQSRILAYLIQLGSRINEVDKNGSSPLMVAIENSNFKAFYYLLLFHADLNCKNNNNDTALILAAKHDALNIVKTLLYYGKDNNNNIENKNKIFIQKFHSKLFNEEEENVEPYIEPYILNNVEFLEINEQNNEGKTALFYAIENENKEMVYELLTCGADPLMKNNKKETALIQAVKVNNENITDLLLNAQNDINEIDENHETALIIAIKNKNLNIIKKLINKNADLTIRDKDSNTPLMIAVRDRQNVTIVKYLLSQPDNTIHYRNKFGISALLLSIETDNNLEIIRLLVEHGASINDVDLKKNNALILASKINNSTVVNYLINVSFDLNQQNQNLNTALIKACKKEKNLSVVKCLIDGKVDLEIKNKKGNTALIVACINKNYRIVSLLLSSKANVECSNNEGITPLIALIQNNNVSMVKMILSEYMANPNYDNPLAKEKMDECFIDAVEHGYTEMVKLLLGHGYNIDISNRNNNFFKLLSALITVTKNSSQFKIVEEIFERPHFKELLEEYRQSTVLITACQDGKKNIIKMLLKYDVNVNVRDVHNDTALIKGSMNLNLYKSIISIISRKAHLDAVNDEGISALLNSCKMKDNKIFKLLINNGANIYVTDIEGNNALMYACSHEDIYKIKYLLNKHIDINYKNREGETALMQAIKKEKVKIVKYLIFRGADVNILNNKNQNALVIAFLASYEKKVVEYNNLVIIKKLIEKRTDPNGLVDSSGNSILMYLIMKNDINMIKYLSKVYGDTLDFNHKNHLGHNAFTYALKYNNDEIIQFLISTNKIDVFEEDDYGNDMIMYSICSLNPEYIKKFTENLHGNIINKCNHNRESYLIMATKLNHEKVIDILIERGANVDHQEAHGNTALHYAALQGNTVTIEKLIKRNANLEIQNYKRETPIMVACRYKQKESIKVLLNNGAQTLFVDNLIYYNEKSFDFKNDQDSYIEMMIDYYAGIADSVPNNYLSTVTLLNRMRRFYEPVTFKERFDVEEIISECFEEFFDFCIDTLTGH